jgi:hypothetical protein
MEELPRQPFRARIRASNACSGHSAFRIFTVRSETYTTAQIQPHSPGESPRRGGGPPLSVGSVGRAERLLLGSQARGPSPRTKGSGDL